jgi:hypothetical protein
MMDKNPQRHCTMPNIPFFRDWFERQYGNLCEMHDEEYVYGKCRLCADWRFMLGMIKQDWRNNKWNLLFSIPAQPFIAIAFLLNNLLYLGEKLWNRS